MKIPVSIFLSFCCANISARAEVVAAYGIDYYSYGPSGKGSLLASAALSFTGTYSPVTVDASNGLVYQLGNLGESTYIAITDLDTGQSSLIPESGAPEFAGFYNGKLVAAYGTSFHYFDPVSGKGALLATSALDFVGSLAPSTIDPVTGLAYQLGNWHGNVYVAVTNLATSQSYRIAEGQYPSFAGAIPEPANFAFWASAAAGLCSFVVRRRRG